MSFLVKRILYNPIAITWLFVQLTKKRKSAFSFWQRIRKILIHSVWEKKSAPFKNESVAVNAERNSIRSNKDGQYVMKISNYTC